ncbi:MAG: transposase [Planctomycetota bacterium]
MFSFCKCCIAIRLARICRICRTCPLPPRPIAKRESVSRWRFWANRWQHPCCPLQARTRGWLAAHRTFLVDGSSFSMSDTSELRGYFGQPSEQKSGCGFPVAHLLAMFHVGTGMLIEAIAAPMTTHDLSQMPLLHPRLEPGDLLVADRGFCSFTHLAILRDRLLHAVFRIHHRMFVDFTPGRPHGRGTKGIPTSRWLCKIARCHRSIGREWFKPRAKAQ